MTVCDVCNRPIAFDDGYALTTTEVTTTVAYWRHIIEQYSMDDQVLAMYVQQQAMQYTGWLVCESCSRKFSFNQARARDYARRQQDPPGSGPADVQRTAAAAAQAWKERHGSWPSWVR